MTAPHRHRLIAVLLLASSLGGCIRHVEIPAADAARVSSMRGGGGPIEVTTLRGKTDVVDPDFTELEVVPRRGASVPERLQFSAPFRVEADEDELVIVDIPRCREPSRRSACRRYVHGGRWSAPAVEQVTRIPRRDVHAVAIQTSPTSGQTATVAVAAAVLAALAVGGAVAASTSSMDIVDTGWR